MFGTRATQYESNSAQIKFNWINLTLLCVWAEARFMRNPLRDSYLILCLCRKSDFCVPLEAAARNVAFFAGDCAEQIQPRPPIDRFRMCAAGCMFVPKMFDEFELLNYACEIRGMCLKCATETSKSHIILRRALDLKRFRIDLCAFTSINCGISGVLSEPLCVSSVTQLSPRSSKISMEIFMAQPKSNYENFS